MPRRAERRAPETDATDWSSLRYAPKERRAPGGARYAPWLQRASAFLIDVSAVLTAVLTVAAPIFVLAGFRDSDPSHSEAALADRRPVHGRAGGRGRLCDRARGPQRADLRQAGRSGSGCSPRMARRAATAAPVRASCSAGSLIGGFAWLLVLPGLLSYLAALWHPLRQTWHDQIGQTIVVRVEHPDPGLRDPASELQHVPAGERDLTAPGNASRLTL